MAATKGDLRGWFDRGVQQGAKYMIVVCDTFDWDDYPVFVSPDEDIAAAKKRYDGTNMQKIMEVYDLTADREAQMSQRRVMAA
jgi:hypothetical protein